MNSRDLITFSLLGFAGYVVWSYVSGQSAPSVPAAPSSSAQSAPRAGGSGRVPTADPNGRGIYDGIASDPIFRVGSEILHTAGGVDVIVPGQQWPVSLLKSFGLLSPSYGVYNGPGGRAGAAAIAAMNSVIGESKK